MILTTLLLSSQFHQKKTEGWGFRVTHIKCCSQGLNYIGSLTTEPTALTTKSRGGSREESQEFQRSLATVKEEGRGCVYQEEGTHHAGLSQAHGQTETGRHGKRQQGLRPEPTAGLITRRQRTTASTTSSVVKARRVCTSGGTALKKKGQAQ